MKNIDAALMQYNAAIQLDPRSTLARFCRATILLKLDRANEALQELLFLKDAAPDYANVHFTLGRVYKKLRNKTDAVRHFTIALNLDPKAQPVIKQVMESWDEDDDIWSSDDES
jgi:anaphase-promoting complex subunit 3